MRQVRMAGVGSMRVGARDFLTIAANLLQAACVYKGEHRPESCERCSVIIQIGLSMNCLPLILTLLPICGQRDAIQPAAQPAYPLQL